MKIMKIFKCSQEHFLLHQISDSLPTKAACRLASEMKAKDGNQGLPAGEKPVRMCTQQQAIDFTSK